MVKQNVYRSGELDPDVDDAVLARLVRVGGDQRAAGILFDRHAPVVRRCDGSSRSSTISTRRRGSPSRFAISRTWS
ncbi:MAG: hypothetical protein U0270_43915 [Labilithrix sp.]